MITSLQKTSYQYLRKLMVLPIAIIVIALFAFNYKANRKPSDRLTKPITVVIDAGHGMNEKGNYTGAIASDGSSEDEIVLNIAKRIRELNTDNNIKIILTRETKFDVSLQQRSEKSNLQNADLLISLHANTASSEDPATSGAQVFISRKNRAHYDDNSLFGKILLDNFSTSIKVNNDVKMRETGIFVLDNSNCPAALVECGFMSDQNDLNFMKSNTGQQTIAKTILKSIEDYGLKNENSKKESSTGLIADTIPSKKWGGVLIIIDGKISDSKAMDMLDVKSIDSIRISTDKKATDKYGEQARNGVIEIVTKKSNQKMVGGIKSKTENRQVDFGKVSDIMRNIDQSDFKTGSINYIEFWLQDPFNKKTNSIGYQDQEASFPGGPAAWNKFLEKNLDASIMLKNRMPNDKYTVWIKFTVDEDGHLSDFTPVTNYNYGLELEAMRVLKLSPEWIPARQNGRNVKEKKLQPITFILFPGSNPKVNVQEIEDKMDVKKLNEVVVTTFNDNNKVWEKTEIPPSYPGGEASWAKFLQSNLNSRIATDNEAPYGKYTAWVQFVVDTNGNVSDIKPLSQHGYGMEKEVIRLIRLSGKWEPAMQNGHKVVAYKKQSVNFIVNNKAEIKLSDLKSSTPSSLIRLPEGELISFLVTIDGIEGKRVQQFAITGKNFTDEVKRSFDDIRDNALVTIENIKYKNNDNVEKSFPSLIRIVSR